MEAKADKKKFFFINKSETSAHLSKSLHEETVAIQRYVQTGRKRVRQSQRVKASAAIQDSNPTQSSTQQESRSANLSTYASSTSTTDRKSQGVSDTSYSIPDRAVCDLRRPTKPLTWQRSLSARDPFNASSVPIDKPVAGLLHYYMYYYHPSQWPDEMTLLRHGVYVFEAAVMRILRAAIADRMTMYCLLGAAACRLQFVDKLPCSVVVGVERGYIVKAIQCLSSYIATANFRDPEQLKRCLICMMFLGSAEAYRGEIGAAKTHLDAAMRLLEPIGGLSALDADPLQGQFAMADLFLACVDLRACSFDCSYDPGPASSLRLDENELDKSCVSAEAWSLLERSRSFILPGMRIIIRDLVESHAIKTHIVTSLMSPARAKQVTHWITIRNMAIRHRLLAFETSDLRCHVLRTAIIMWTLLAMNITGRAKTVKIMAPKLRDSLSSILQPYWTENEDIKFWILLVGLYCANDDSEDLEWFLREARGSMSCCVPMSTAHACTFDFADRLEVFQHNFFYDVPAQNARTRILAERLSGRETWVDEHH